MANSDPNSTFSQLVSSVNKVEIDSKELVKTETPYEDNCLLFNPELKDNGLGNYEKYLSEQNSKRPSPSGEFTGLRVPQEPLVDMRFLSSEIQLFKDDKQFPTNYYNYPSFEQLAKTNATEPEVQQFNKNRQENRKVTLALMNNLLKTTHFDQNSSILFDNPSSRDGRRPPQRDLIDESIDSAFPETSFPQKRSASEMDELYSNDILYQKLKGCIAPPKTDKKKKKTTQSSDPYEDFLGLDYFDSPETRRKKKQQKSKNLYPYEKFLGLDSFPISTSEESSSDEEKPKKKDEVIEMLRKLYPKIKPGDINKAEERKKSQTDSVYNDNLKSVGKDVPKL